jgi:hypothetical protein
MYPFRDSAGQDRVSCHWLLPSSWWQFLEEPLVLASPIDYVRCARLEAALFTNHPLSASPTAITGNQTLRPAGSSYMLVMRHSRVL